MERKTGNKMDLKQKMTKKFVCRLIWPIALQQIANRKKTIPTELTEHAVSKKDRLLQNQIKQKQRKLLVKRKKSY